ncbi:MAG: Rrf2 family transcriptional regulator [Lachnospiraceae bacterium]|nr:Rrf2 family transcriptional regulator [Lachnospiraceae bacterium]
MKISTKGRYALRLMIDLATKNVADTVTRKDLVDWQQNNNNIE